MVQSVLNQRLHLLVLGLMRMDIVLVQLVLYLVLLPVEESLQIPQRIICYSLVEFALYFAFTGSVNTSVVDHQLPSLRKTRRLHTHKIPYKKVRLNMILLTFVIHFQQMTQEKEHFIADILMRKFLLALLAIHTRDHRLVASLVYSWELDVFRAFGVRTD